MAHEPLNFDEWERKQSLKLPLNYPGSAKEPKVRCYHSHPPMPLPGTSLVIYGGSCLSPAVTDADVYIGFDHAMIMSPRHWPWRQGHEIKYKIADMCAPTKVEDFRSLVTWTKGKLEEGLKVHAGCIGGHGRTGMFLAALVSEFGEKDAFNYVRKNYCHRAVESQVQMDFLASEYDVKPIVASKMADKTMVFEHLNGPSIWAKV